MDQQSGEKVGGTFARFALPIVWDFVEVCNHFRITTGTLSRVHGMGCSSYATHLCSRSVASPSGESVLSKGLQFAGPVKSVRCDLTDPPYYDAIPYSDAMDFFYVWLRRFLTKTDMPNADQLIDQPTGAQVGP